MWTDNETEKDFVNFDSIAKTVSEIIISANNEPISIGVSGSWGVGKSSLVKLISKSMQSSSSDKNFIYVEFNAWLYQGYDDARAALMESIASKLIIASKENETLLAKANFLLKRVNWLRASQVAAKTVVPLMLGLPPIGIAGEVLAGAKALLDGSIQQNDLSNAMSVAAKATKEAHGLLRDPETKSPPQEIQALRDDFQETLKALNSTLVVLIDDLDRCLPDTTISTLEAIRLFLFLPNTAFVIAADQKMIRHAVKKHFGNIEDELVTNYFDKLIQVPLQVPPLGTQEVRAYMILLFVESSTLSTDQKNSVIMQVNKQLKMSWKGARVDKEFMSTVAEVKSDNSLTAKFDLVQRLALIMTTSPQINGNPRLIKRFLNALSIRQSIARSNGIMVDEEALAKMLLFERCGDTKCYKDILNSITNSDNGKIDFLEEWEQAISKGQDPDLEEHWKGDFEQSWLRLDPMLSDIDLRGILYIGREHSPIITAEDKLSAEALDILKALSSTPGTAKALLPKIKVLSKADLREVSGKILKSASRVQEWGTPPVLDDLIALSTLDAGITDLVKAFFLERPVEQIKPAFIPKIKGLSCWKELLTAWEDEANGDLKRAISAVLGKK